MPVLTVDYDDLLHVLGTVKTTAEITSLLEKLGAEAVFDDKKQNFEIEILPNRPDMLSVEGIARVLKLLLGLKKAQPYVVKKSFPIRMNVERSVKSIRPYVVCALIKNVVLSEKAIRALMDCQEKLHLTIGRKRKKASIGVHDFDRIQPPFVYKAVAPKSVSFVPLGWTVEKNLAELLQTHEKGIEYKYILEGLKKYPIICDAKGTVISFPPIINAALTTVTEKTTNLFVEVTGIDFNAVNTVLNIFCTAIVERSGEINSVTIKDGKREFTTPELRESEMELKLSFLNATLNTNLTPQVVVEKLEQMGYRLIFDKDRFVVQVPPYRIDVHHPIDLVEDFAIAYGYENIHSVLPKVMTTGVGRGIENYCMKLRKIMTGFGFTEVVTFTLSNPAEQYTLMNLPVDTTVLATIKNPITKEHTCLRVWLLPSLMKVLASNKHCELPQKIFEVNDVIISGKNKRKIAALVMHHSASFTEIKSLFEAFLRDLGISTKLEPLAHGSFIEGRCAAAIGLKKGFQIGFFGELRPEVIVNYELENPVAGFEVDVEFLTLEAGD